MGRESEAQHKSLERLLETPEFEACGVRWHRVGGGLSTVAEFEAMIEGQQVKLQLYSHELENWWTAQVPVRGITVRGEIGDTVVEVTQRLLGWLQTS